jgi:hypothetical protein
MNNVPVHENDLSSRAKMPNEKARHLGKHKKISFKKFICIAATIVILAAATTGGYLFYKSSVTSYIETDKYQAVFLTNGQVYFGKLTKLSGEYFKLSKIFYLQTQTTSTTSTVQAVAEASADNVQLIKLGSEIHGPEDEMVISKSQILFFENTKKSGQVTAAIDKYYSQNK